MVWVKYEVEARQEIQACKKRGRRVTEGRRNEVAEVASSNNNQSRARAGGGCGGGTSKQASKQRGAGRGWTGRGWAAGASDSRRPAVVEQDSCGSCPATQPTRPAPAYIFQPL
ncbi:hypothetical protein Pcinc_041197 [Petrolisthes cinctipes]|uniref:Uncharacterized protein n=1 Tax=Petrolisthes cinctipes TaxID=88211 RepID=A0AAE1EH64_PETCI|nr:hypothetical protein Pcinc_041197 [Petrolisthes cinctipes]